MIKLYKTILPIAAILNLVFPIVLISSLVARANVSSTHDLIGTVGIHPISEPSILILLGISLIGLAKISRKKFKS
jgi:hypothetical protein